MTTMMMNRETTSQISPLGGTVERAETLNGHAELNRGSGDKLLTKRGRLVIAGSGIAAISHMTLETIGHIQSADIVFYHATSGVVATQINTLNNNTVDLYEYYGEGKRRTSTYLQMAELMLRDVRKGSYVVGVFHGHPGFFVKAGRRSLAIARIEGHDTELLAAISAPDCLFADLRIDPGVIGVQILKAGHILRADSQIATDNHLLLLQVSSVGDNTFSYNGYNKAKLDLLFEKLTAIYGDKHESVYYVAPIFPGFDPTIKVRCLGEYQDHEIRETISASTLYIPPAGVTLSSLTALQAFDNVEPYSAEEEVVLSEIDHHRTPPGYKRRGASSAMMSFMHDIAMSPSEMRRYRNAPTEFVKGYEDLSGEERDALARRSVAAMRKVTDEHGNSQQNSRPPIPRGISKEDAFEISRKAPTSCRQVPSSSRLSMHWAPDRQLLRYGTREFVHEGPISTHPSHDVAHLLIAANGRMPWCPEGNRRDIRIAEYNAVFLEHLLTNILATKTFARRDDEDVFRSTLYHARWFVEEHFKPFPIAAEEVYSEFRRSIDPKIVFALCPYFYLQKRAEQVDPAFMFQSWNVEIGDDDGSLLRSLEPALLDAVARQLKRIAFV